MKTRFPLAFPRRNIETASPVLSLIQSCIVSLHTNAGIPWWATFGASTLLVRLSLFPLVRYQLLTSNKLMKAAPELRFLWQLFRQKLQNQQLPLSDKIKTFFVFQRGLSACLLLNDVSLFELLAYPLSNMAIFITFVYSLRDMLINHGEEYGMEDGGFLFCRDLSQRDDTFVLPLISISLSYFALEHGLLKSSGKTILLMKDALQSVVLLLIPFITPMPAGVFFYWIPSHIIGILQTSLLRQKNFRKVIMEEKLKFSSLVKLILGDGSSKGKPH